MLNDLSAEYYQKIKKGFKKGLVKSIGIFLKKKKKKSEKMVANDKKIFLRMKKKG